LVRHVERDGLLKVAPLLFRNSFLNEGDIYISPQRRGRIWARLAPTAEQLQALGDATTAYLNRELPLMAATGSLPRMSMDVTPEKIDLVKRGARMRMKAAREQQDAGQDMSAQIAEIQDELDNPERHAHSVIPGRSGVVGVQLGAHVYQAPMRALPGGDLLVDTANYLRATFGMMCLTRFELEGTVSVERLRQERERIDHVFQQVVSESTRPK
jgi:hypothetical protein